MIKRTRPQLRHFLLLFALISSLVFIQQYSHLFAFTKEVLGKYLPVKWVLLAHVAGGASALLLGPFQFLKSLRRRSLQAHRWIGRLYLGAVLLSASGALVLTFTTTDAIGTMYTVSLWALALVWSVSTALGLYTIRMGKVLEHEEWMVRSYLITFAFVVQNYVLKIPAVVALASFPELSPNIFWFSWSAPLFIHQVYLTMIKVRKRSGALSARISG
jgi:hypothetical protein